MAFGLCRCWPGISAEYEYEVLSAPEFPIQAPRGWRDVRPGPAKYPERPWLARSSRVYSPSPLTPACPGFEENPLDLDGFQDVRSAWAVATVGAEVKWCCEGG